MPGRTVPEALTAFIDPIQSAVACLGSAKISLSPGARGDIDTAHAWTLNSDDGMRHGRLGFRPRMRFRYLKLDPEKAEPGHKWRVTTMGYMYEITMDEEPIVDYHWHPDSNPRPHQHFGAAVLAPDGVITPRTHLATGRTSIEDMVRLLLAELKWKPAVDDWEGKPALSEGVFRLYSSWRDQPPPRPPTPRQPGLRRSAHV